MLAPKEHEVLFLNPARKASRTCFRTVVGGEERGVVHAVLHEGRLAVQDCHRGDAACVGVDPEPVGGVMEFGVPDWEIRFS